VYRKWQAIRQTGKEQNLTSVISQIWHLLSQSFYSKLIGIVLGSSLLFATYLLISRTVVYNSDDASIILEAQSMLNGNFILHGWYVPTDNFLTIEIPLYALGLLLGFSTSSLLHIIPSLLYILIVISGGYLASTLLQGKQRIWSVFAFLGIVAFPPLAMVQRLLVGPVHMGTILFTLIGLIAYRLYLTGKKGRKVAFAILLLVITLAVIGDPFALVFFALPLILTEGLQTLVQKRRSLRENSILSGVLLAIILAFGIRELTELAGLHNLVTAGFVLTNIPGMASNFISAIKWLFVLFHANIFAENSPSLSSIPVFINALLLIALIYTAIRWSIHALFVIPKKSHTTAATTQILNILLWGSAGILASFTLSTLGGDSGARYLYPLFFFSGIISLPLMCSFINRHALIFVIMLALLANTITFAIALYQAPNAITPEAQLITVLEEHHLRQGIGTYWVSPIVTVQSEEQVVIRQILISSHQIHPYYFLADEAWFNRSNLQGANFIVYRESDGPQAYYDTSVRSFGMPDHQYHTGTYTILTWNTPLLTHMQPGYSFWTS
jgi:hypothetical protein